MLSLFFAVLASTVAGVHLSRRFYPSDARGVTDSSTTAFHQGVRSWKECSQLCATAAGALNAEACLVGCAADGMNNLDSYTYTNNGLTSNGLQWKGGVQNELRNDTTAFQTCDDWCGRPADYWYDLSSPSNGNIMRQGRLWALTKYSDYVDSCYSDIYDSLIGGFFAAEVKRDSMPSDVWDDDNPATLSGFTDGGVDDCLIGCQARNLLEPADLSCAAGESETLTAIDEAPWVDIECDTILCLEDEYVSSNECVACAEGSTNPAGDDATGSDTTCDSGEDDFSPASSIQANVFLMGVCAFLFEML